MIRKCGRLSRVWGGSGPGTGTLFRTVYAPADFRLKEMEKWIRYQENPGKLKHTSSIEPPLSKRSSIHSIKRRSSFCCDRCTADAAAAAAAAANVEPQQRPATVHRRPPRSNRSSWVEIDPKKPLARRSSTSSIHSISIQDGQKVVTQTVYRTSSAIEDHARGIHAVIEPYIETSAPRRRSSALFSTDGRIVESPRVLSPEPLPHPYRPRSYKSFAVDDDSSDTTDDDDDDTDNDTINPLPPPQQRSPPRSDSGSTAEALTRPPLLHRRSSLKKSSGSIRTSMDVTKSVAWAVDQDWQDIVKKYDDAAKDAEAAGKSDGHIKLG